MKLLLLQDYKADGDTFPAGQLFATSDEAEAKDLLFSGKARLAEKSDEEVKPDKPGLNKEEIVEIVSTRIKAEFEAERKVRETDPDVGAGAGQEDDAKPFKSFGEQLISIMKADMPGGEIDPRLATVAKATGMSESLPSEGGFLVQQDFSTELLRLVHETGTLPGRCRKLPIGPDKNGLLVNAVAESSRATGSRWGGIQCYWKDEAGTKAPTKPKLRQMRLDLKKLIGAYYATDELLQDTVALESFMMQAFTEEFGFMMDDGIVNGLGAGQLLGIMNSPCKVAQPKEANQAAATIVSKNIMKMWTRLWARSMPNAVWLINQSCWEQIFGLTITVGTGGAPMYIEPGKIKDAPYGALLGRPILPIEQCQALGTEGDIILADLSQFLLIDKGGIQSQSSIHVKFLNDETVFRFVYRVDGQPTWIAPLTPYKDTGKTQSPFITLAVRA